MMITPRTSMVMTLPTTSRVFLTSTTPTMMHGKLNLLGLVHNHEIIGECQTSLAKEFESYGMFKICSLHDLVFRQSIHPQQYQFPGHLQVVPKSVCWQHVCICELSHTEVYLPGAFPSLLTPTPFPLDLVPLRHRRMYT